jgi:hypothetical protein
LLISDRQSNELYQHVSRNTRQCAPNEDNYILNAESDGRASRGDKYCLLRRNCGSPLRPVRISVRRHSTNNGKNYFISVSCVSPLRSAAVQCARTLSLSQTRSQQCSLACTFHAFSYMYTNSVPTSEETSQLQNRGLTVGAGTRRLHYSSHMKHSRVFYLKTAPHARRNQERILFRLTFWYTKHTLLRKILDSVPNYPTTSTRTASSNRMTLHVRCLGIQWPEFMRHVLRGTSCTFGGQNTEAFNVKTGSTCKLPPRFCFEYFTLF